jgi:hypothetical protein
MHADRRIVVRTELNDSRSVAHYNWLVRHDPELHIRTKAHREWCKDPNCGTARRDPA